MKFAVVDVETVNRDRSSICQIGVVIATKDAVLKKWSVLVHPQVEFDSFVSSHHRITPGDVEHAPSFAEIHDEMTKILDGHVVYQYANSKFDQDAIEGACSRYELRMPKVEWRDATQLVRQAWDDIEQTGYKLSDVCARLGIEYQHHDALEDACATAKVLQTILNQSAVGKGGMVPAGVEAAKKISSRRNQFEPRIRLEGKEGLPLSGKTFLFSDLEGKETLALKAQALGADVAPGFSRKVTHLVTSEEIILGTAAATGKFTKVKEANAGGADIKILSLSDFLALISSP